MEEIIGLKGKGNALYMKATKLGPSDERVRYFREACIIYGSALEELMSFESQLSNQQGSSEAEPHSSIENEEFHSLKPTLFLNLAAGNLHLNAFEGCRRCCNSCLLFCNNPTLPLEFMGIDDDVTMDVQLNEPVAPCRIKYACKALFRRGKCYEGIEKFEYARRDFTAALRLCPNDKELIEALKVTDNAMRSATNIHDDASSSSKIDELKSMIPDCKSSIREEDIFALTVNGGFCLYRNGYWSQSIDYVEISLPSFYLIDKAINKLDSGAKQWDVTFETRAIEVVYCGKCVLSEPTEYFITPAESTWTVETISNIRFLVLHLRKAASIEWFPGCEWWDRVFDYDEPIETTTCSLGTSVAELPQQARDRADREYQRFSQLSLQSQQSELDNCRSLKKQFIESELKTRHLFSKEDAAIAAVPERAEMLSALRKEFPTIDFSAR